MGAVVEKLHADFKAIVDIMDRNGEVSFRTTLEDSFRKALLLCAASHFEHRITTDVINFCQEVSGKNTLVPSLVKNKAVSRQYHTWFDWGTNNANTFFSLFGDEFRSHMTKHVSENEALATSISAFIELGRERNRLVHQDYGSYSLEKTADEIFALYNSAVAFVDAIPNALREFSAREVSPDLPVEGQAGA